KQLRWRTGVVLEFEGNCALIKADSLARKVAISINGPVPGRRRLLAVIRSDFDAIHQNLRKIQAQEIVPVNGRPELLIPYSKLKVLERNGKRKFDEVLGNEVVELDVRDMLNGVDLEAVLPRTASLTPNRHSVFISYSHKDENLRSELETHLKLLQRQGLIS